MKKIILLSALASAMLTSFAAQAAESAELKVTGVIKPAACRVNFPGTNGSVTYTIKTDSLKPNDYNPQPDKSVSMVLECGSETRVGFGILDNKATSRITGLFGPALGQNFGLGMQGTNKIGGYKLEMTENLADTTRAFALVGEDKNGPWTRDALVKRDKIHSLTTGESTNPTPLKKFSTTFKVSTTLNKGSELNLNDEIALDGSSTIQIEYL